jgi:predicted transcriptional regulator of viral defense system
MQYNQFKEQLKDFTVFSTTDIHKVYPDFHRRRLNEWQDKGYIKKLRRGYYMFADTQLNEERLFLIANRLYAPSYVSFEMALSYYNLIPEGVYSITSATSKKTEKFKTPIGEFSYRSLKPQLFFGYSLQQVNPSTSLGAGQQYKLAEIEKAVLDYLYLNPKSARKGDLQEWRFNAQEFLARVDMEKFNRYVKVFNSPSLERRAKQFIRFVQH